MLLLILQRYEFSSKSQPAGVDKPFNTCCCWYYKGTNFQANHNLTHAVNYGNMVVADTTKVRIFKQITTLPKAQFDKLSCCWYYKGTNFQANHNWVALRIALKALLLILQRYEFSSKSQQQELDNLQQSCCCWYYKGTNFQANHNFLLSILLQIAVVADTTKVRIFKQITTKL